MVAEIPFNDLSTGRQLDDSNQASLSLPMTGKYRSQCCDVLNEATPWRHEVACYRDNDEPFVGPLVSVEASAEGGVLSVQDLFFWMERRFISEDMFFSADASVAFEGIFLAALAPDTSPNISIIGHDSGEDVVRQIIGKEFQRAADLLRELARTALDFTTIGRTVLVGGRELFEVGIGPGVPLVVHDDAVAQMTVTKDGVQFATDVAVFGEAISTGSDDRITGRATRSSDYYGLVQQSFAELEIRDTPSADDNALSRLRQLQPSPITASITFTPSAAFTYADLLPGRRADMRISEAAGCIPVMQTMRLSSVDVSVQVSEDTISESVTGEFVPLGQEDEV